MTTDFRALCAELAGWIERSTRHYIQDPEVLIRARAALAGPVGGGPTDEELDRLEHPHWEETGVEEWGRREAIFNHRSYARAVLARYGHQPAPPAEGEVAELVAWLRGANWDGKRQSLATRAADLLEQRHLAPVPVAERLPRPEDCDAEGRCWWWRTDNADEWWELLCISDAREYNAGCGNARYTHWLPATALPLPQGEVQP